MGVTLSDISDLARGWRDPIVVGEIPDWLRLKLSVRVPVVHLSKESLLHIRRKHPDMTEFDLLRTSIVIERGSYMQEKAKPQMILSVHRDDEMDRQYVAVMKLTNRSCELWLQSFHRCHARQIERWKKKHTLLAPHQK